MDTQFAGDKKKGDWLLAKAESRMVNWMVPRVPPFIETYHLTLLTLVWSIGIVACGYFARENINWLLAGFPLHLPPIHERRIRRGSR